MLKDIVEVSVRPPHKLWVRFEDGVNGEVDVAEITNFAGVFASLRDEVAFATVAVNAELGTVQWPTGADLDPDVIYAAISGSDVKMAALG